MSRISDLCAEDKQKVATLIQQVVKVSDCYVCVAAGVAMQRLSSLHSGLQV